MLPQAEFTAAHKSPHPATECFRQGGDTIEGELSVSPYYSDLKMERARIPEQIF
jgi:hypothetical protein